MIRLRRLLASSILAVLMVALPPFVQRLDIASAATIDLSEYRSVPLPAPPAQASFFSPPNDRWIAYAEYNQVIPALAKTGTATWVATDNYGWSKWTDVVSQSLDRGSPYAQSLGNVLRNFINIREARGSETPLLRHRAETSSYTAGKCGGSFATACIYIYDGLPVNVYYNAAAMITFIFTGQAATVEHETFHGITNACDQYRGGCPPTNDESFQCTGNSDTLMDCGLAARYPQAYDIATFLGAFTPDHVTQVSLRLENGGVRLSWNCTRKDGGFAAPFLDSCRISTEVTFAFWKRSQDPAWVGVLGCTAEFNFCYTDPYAASRWWDSYWTENFDCAGLRMENGPTRLIAQSSQLGLNGSSPGGYFQILDCWR